MYVHYLLKQPGFDWARFLCKKCVYWFKNVINFNEKLMTYSTTNMPYIYFLKCTLDHFPFNYSWNISHISVSTQMRPREKKDWYTTTYRPLCLYPIMTNLATAHVYMSIKSISSIKLGLELLMRNLTSSGGAPLNRVNSPWVLVASWREWK